MRLINFRAFKEAKILAFFKYWQLNIVDEINVDGHLIHTDNLYPLISDVISAYESNQSGFSLHLQNKDEGEDQLLFSAADERIFLKMINIIWKNPDSYFTIDEDTLNKGGNYYDYFLSKLFVKITNGVADYKVPCSKYIQRNPEFIKVF